MNRTALPPRRWRSPRPPSPWWSLAGARRTRVRCCRATAGAAPTAPAAADAARRAHQPRPPRLALGPVDPPEQEGHTTYRLDEEPEIGVLWTYAEPNPDGSYRHVGGGAYDAGDRHLGPGRVQRRRRDPGRRRLPAALAGDRVREQPRRGLRDAPRRHLPADRRAAPNAGNVVLWMQPDGTLNPSAEPVELPDPSDSDASYWLARTIWALGEGYAAFERRGPRVRARSSRDRLELPIDAVDRQVLDRVRRPPRHRRRAAPPRG